MNLVKFLQTFVFRGGAAVWPSGSDRPDHNILGGMFQAGKFDHCDIVAAGFQFQSPQTVRENFGEPIFENSMLEHGSVKSIADLSEKLVLTAWNGKNDPGIPFYGIDQREICGSVSGMEGDDHIGVVICIVRDISHKEPQMLIMEIGSDPVAEFDYIFF